MVSGPYDVAGTIVVFPSQSAFAIVAATEEPSSSGRRDKKTGYAAGEWDIAKMAPKLKGQA